MIIHTHKLIIVHVPRAGGTSIEEFFGDATGRHNPASWYRENYPEAWERYRKIVLVRDDTARARSIWQYWANLKQMRWGQFENPTERHRCYWRFVAHAGLHPMGLVKAMEELRNAPWSDNHFKPQRWFADTEGLEVMPLEALGLDGLPHLNKSLKSEVEIPNELVELLK